MNESLYRPLDKRVCAEFRNSERLRKIDTYLAGSYDGGFGDLWEEEWERRCMGLVPPIYNVSGMAKNKNPFDYSCGRMKDSRKDMAARIILW